MIEAVKIDISNYITNYEYMIHFMQKLQKLKICVKKPIKKYPDKVKEKITRDRLRKPHN